MWETGLEVWLEPECAGTHMPRAVFQLRAEQILRAAPIWIIGHSDPSRPEGIQRLAGRIGVGGHCLPLRPTTVGALQREHARLGPHHFAAWRAGPEQSQHAKHLVLRILRGRRQ